MCSILQPDWSLLLQGSLHCKQGSLQETLFYNFQWYVEQNLYPPHLYKGENDLSYMYLVYSVNLFVPVVISIHT